MRQAIDQSAELRYSPVKKVQVYSEFHAWFLRTRGQKLNENDVIVRTLISRLNDMVDESEITEDGWIGFGIKNTEKEMTNNLNKAILSKKRRDGVLPGETEDEDEVVGEKRKHSSLVEWNSVPFVDKRCRLT